MLNKEYVHDGKCIWCGRKKPNVTFNTIPHILPKSLGGLEIGVDVCDECNHYFGTAEKRLPAIDTVIREIFESYRLFGTTYYKDKSLPKKFTFFHYNFKTGRLKLKNTFRDATITSQFKRGLYELFLQKYHCLTFKGNEHQWDWVRSYARYGTKYILREPHVFYAFNNITFLPGEEYLNFVLMSEKMIEDAMKYGVFNIFLMGQNFYIEVLPHTFQQYGRTYLQTVANSMLVPAKGNERLFEFTSIKQIDPFMTRYVS